MVGQTPPPLHGQALAIQALVQGPVPGVEVQHLRMHFSAEVDQIGRFRAGKLLHLASLAGRGVWILARQRDLILYYPPGATLMPLLRDVVLLSLWRPLAWATVLHFHAGGVSEFVEQRSWLRSLARRALGRADAAIHLLPSATPDGQYFEAGRVFNVPNGVDVPVATRSRPADDDEFRLLFVGLHTESKGVLQVLEAVHRLRQRGVRARAHMVGQWRSADEERAARLLLRRLELDPDAVHFCGRLEGSAKWQQYADADAFFFPTTYEAELMPLVLLEAMAHSLPVVATRWRCIPDVVQHGRSGSLFSPGDLPVAVEQLESLARDPGLRQERGRAGRQRYLRLFTLKRHLSAMAAVFHQVTAKGFIPL